MIGSFPYSYAMVHSDRYPEFMYLARVDLIDQRPLKLSLALGIGSDVIVMIDVSKAIDNTLRSCWPQKEQRSTLLLLYALKIMIKKCR